MSESLNANQQRVAQGMFQALEQAVTQGENWQAVLEDIVLVMAMKGGRSLNEDAGAAREYMRNMFKQLHGVPMENYQQQRHMEEGARGLGRAERLKAAQMKAMQQPGEQGRGRSR